MSVDAAAVAKKIAAAKAELAAAEDALDRTIKDLRRRNRAQKEIIAPALEAAFARLVSAREALGEVEQMIAERS